MKQRGIQGIVRCLPWILLRAIQATALVGWLGLPIIVLRKAHHSPQMIKKPDSSSLALATTAILGQAPRNLPCRRANSSALLQRLACDIRLGAAASQTMKQGVFSP